MDWIEKVKNANGNIDVEIPASEYEFAKSLNINHTIWATYTRNNIDYVNVGFSIEN